MRLFGWFAYPLGRAIARYINRPIAHYERTTVTGAARLAQVLQPADVLLVEGDRRISTAIKYLTQSTWSHAALYVGDALGEGVDPETAPVLVEADVEAGVITAPLSKFARLNTRICRPVGLGEDDRRAVIDYVCTRIGHGYDLKNVVDLARYLFPTPPVPTRWRRRMIAFGSGDPTRAICSTLIAQAFQSVRYPILPIVERLPTSEVDDGMAREILHIRHFSLFTPRDFDISPYFRVIKPTLEDGFDFRALNWADRGRDSPAQG